MVVKCADAHCASLQGLRCVVGAAIGRPPEICERVFRITPYYYITTGGGMSIYSCVLASEKSSGTMFLIDGFYRWDDVGIVPYKTCATFVGAAAHSRPQLKTET